ncbi:uncharacterized protein [Ptychodera flava]|uniref:uncharacterized protein n=1 Tax=Ptychodera flava TaxID=63121 RepID=UPI00396A5B7A
MTLVCRGIQARIFACVLFALLYVISGAMLTTIGILGGMDDANVTNGCSVWIGIFIVAAAVTMIALSVFPRKESSTYRKMFQVLAMLSISAIVILLCFVNIMILALYDRQGSNEDNANAFIDFVFVHYLSILGTSIGLVASLLAFLFIFCALILPLRRGEVALRAKQNASILERRPTPYHIPHARIKHNQLLDFQDRWTDENFNLNDVEPEKMDSQSVHDVSFEEERPLTEVHQPQLAEPPITLNIDNVLVTKL